MTPGPAWAPQHVRRGTLHAVASAVRAFLLDPPEAAVPARSRGRPPDPWSPSSGWPAAVGRRSWRGLSRPSSPGVILWAPAWSPETRGAQAYRWRPRRPPDWRGRSRTCRVGRRPLGRLCLVRGADPSSLADALPGLAPLVLDAGSAALGGTPACVADRTLVVTTPAIEPALARVAIDCVSRVGPEPTLVLNRARRPGRSAPSEPGACEAQLLLPETRLGAQLALGGREVRGVLGRAIAALVDGWEGGA